MSEPSTPEPRVSRVSRLSLPAPSTGALARRAVLALALWVGFYVLGLALVLGLLWIPWASIHYQGSIGIAGLACGAAALWIAWALVPPFPRSKSDDAPTPLSPSAHPRLFAMLGELSRRVGEPPPDEVFLLPEVNAFAGRETRFLVAGGKRTVGIGLPLLAALDEPSVRAVLAHELGHHRAGDMRLGPIVHRTRMAAATAVQRLSDSSFWLHLPFALYAKLFMRVTVAVTREQELEADRLAARVAGPRAVGRALAITERLAPRWDAYFRGEYLELLSRGIRPPLLEGFARFLASRRLREGVREAIARAEARPPAEHDTHPPLDERLASLGLGEAATEREGESALSLLSTTRRAEDAAIALLLRSGHPPLTEVSWEDVGERVWIPMWRHELSSHAALAPLGPLDVPRVLDDAPRWAARLRGDLVLISPEAEKKRLVAQLGHWLCVWLHDRGAHIEVPPGEEAVATRNGVSERPAELVHALVARRMRAPEYRARIEALLGA